MSPINPIAQVASDMSSLLSSPSPIRKRLVRRRRTRLVRRRSCKPKDKNKDNGDGESSSDSSSSSESSSESSSGNSSSDDSPLSGDNSKNYMVDTASNSTGSGDASWRYRLQRGVNLGSWFTTENWMVGSLYDKLQVYPGDGKIISDQDLGHAPNAKSVLENHWDSWITDEDWQWLEDKGFNSVRLPFGFYHLAGAQPDLLDGTPFEGTKDAYSGAFERIEKAVETAGKHGMGVLLDLHAAPGGQNPEMHSGQSSGQAQFFGNDHYKKQAAAALLLLATKFANNSNVIGLQLLNEPQAGHAEELKSFYSETLNQIRDKVGKEFPIYIHDGWDLNDFGHWAAERDDLIVLDTHRYKCFGDDVQQNAGHWAGTYADPNSPDVKPLIGDGGAYSYTNERLVVGEWSGCSIGSNDEQTAEFYKNQLKVFAQTSGYFFWSYKLDYENVAWSVRNAIEKGLVPDIKEQAYNPAGEPLKALSSKRARDLHISHQKRSGIPVMPEHFDRGFTAGWEEAQRFFERGEQLQLVTRWAEKRHRELSILDKRSTWVEGFRSGYYSARDNMLVFPGK